MQEPVPGRPPDRGAARAIQAEGKTPDEMTAILTEANLPCPVCGNRTLTDARQFNMMFRTTIGPVGETGVEVYLRPETAQAMFVQYKKHLSTTARVKLPFGIAQIGKSFRNEITPGNFIFRDIEFEQMEIEYFVRPTTRPAPSRTGSPRCRVWVASIGLCDEPRPRPRARDRRALALLRPDDRLSNTLSRHGLEGTLWAGQPDRFRPFAPSGVQRRGSHLFRSGSRDVRSRHRDRTDLRRRPNFSGPAPRRLRRRGDRRRQRQTGHARPAPPLPEDRAIQGGDPAADEEARADQVARGLFDRIQTETPYLVDYDETGNIGKRYRRQDEVGTPFCFTIDYETLDDASGHRPRPRHDSSGTHCARRCRSLGCREGR